MSCTEEGTKQWRGSSALQPKVLAQPRNTRNATQLGFSFLLQLQLGSPQINDTLREEVSFPERNLAQDEQKE